MKTISVVIPYHNDSSTVDRALSSVQYQSVKPLEVIVVNDASFGSERYKLHQVVSRYSEDLAVKVIDLEENGGPSVARNAGWNQAKGDYIAFLDSDDSWQPQKLEIQLEVMRSNEVGIVGTRSERDCSQLFFNLKGAPKLSPISIRQQLFRNRFRTSSIMIQRGVPVRFHNEWRYAEDFDVWCRTMLSGHKALIIELPLTVYHKSLRSSVGLSGNLWKMFIGEFLVYRTLKKDGLISYSQSALCYISSILRFVRRIFISIGRISTGKRRV